MAIYDGCSAYAMQKDEEQRASRREEDPLKLAACYQAGGEIISAWNTLKNLPADKKGRVFHGFFVENNDQITGHLSFESPAEFNMRVNKHKKTPQKIDIYIHADRSIYFRSIVETVSVHRLGVIKRDGVTQLHTKSSDNIIAALLAWAAHVDPDLDSKIKTAIQSHNDSEHMQITSCVKSNSGGTNSTGPR